MLVVWKQDRLSRSLRDVLTIMERIQEAKAGFPQPHRGDRTPRPPAGRMMMQMIGSFAEFERAMLRERTRVGLESARGRGPVSEAAVQSCYLSNRQRCSKWWTQGKKTAADAARLFNVHPATIGRLLARKSGAAVAGKR